MVANFSAETLTPPLQISCWLIRDDGIHYIIVALSHGDRVTCRRKTQKAGVKQMGLFGVTEFLYVYKFKAYPRRLVIRTM